jgi:hypothetical protein
LSPKLFQPYTKRDIPEAKGKAPNTTAVPSKGKRRKLAEVSEAEGSDSAEGELEVTGAKKEPEN